MVAALWLTRGAQKTFPVLHSTAARIGDSTAIIAALEQRWPEPAAVPRRPGRARRALELEDFFDEQLGPDLRLLAWHELRQDPERIGRALTLDAAGPGPRIRPRRRAAAKFGSTYVELRFRVASDEARRGGARQRSWPALDRLEAELDAAGSEHLAGDDVHRSPT